MPYKRLPSDLPTRLRAAGLKVVVIDGWHARGRPARTGGFNPVGVLWHHTGAKQNGLTYAKWLFLTGRTDLPAPLCQLSIDRQGTVYVGAGGRANHAGQAKASGTVAAGDGNSLYIGVECQNTGSEGWPKAQYNAMVKTGSVLMGVTGNSVKTNRGHKETSVTGKWDPGKLDMGKFRDDIAKAHKAKKPKPKTRGKHIDRMLEDAKAAKKVAVETKNAPRAKRLDKTIADIKSYPYI